MSFDRLLNRLYYARGGPAFLAGAAQLYRTARSAAPRVRLTDVREFLERQATATSFRQPRLRAPRTRVHATGLSTHVGVDLADLSRLAHWNGGHRWLLVAVDVFSRQVRLRAVRRKQPRLVVEALRSALESLPATVWTVLTDRGREWAGDVRRWLASAGIRNTQMRGRYKNAHAERMVRTAVGRLHRYMDAAQTRRWVDLLPQLQRTLNAAGSRPLGGAAPDDVRPSNERALHRYLYDEDDAPIRFRYAVGQRVRRQLERGTFTKGYKRTYSVAPYTIVERMLHRRPATYRIRDDFGSEQLALETELTNYGTETGPRRHYDSGT